MGSGQGISQSLVSLSDKIVSTGSVGVGLILVQLRVLDY